MKPATPSIVMPALGAGIHDFSRGIQVVDGRAKPGHDGSASVNRPKGGHDGFAFLNRTKGGHDALACVASYEVAP